MATNTLIMTGRILALCVHITIVQSQGALVNVETCDGSRFALMWLEAAFARASNRLGNLLTVKVTLQSDSALVC